jgi:hypothetical protein
MSYGYVVRAELKSDGSIVIVVNVSEFVPGESVEITGYVTQAGGAFATFYDVQIIPAPDFDGTSQLTVSAVTSEEFTRGKDITVVSRVTKSWVTILGTGNHASAQEITAWDDVRYVQSAGWSSGPVDLWPRQTRA